MIALDIEKNKVSNLMSSEEQRRRDKIVVASSIKHQPLVCFEDSICAYIKDPWHYEVRISSEEWFPATFLQAHIGGTVDVIVLLGSVQRFQPRLQADHLRQFASSNRPFPEVQTDLHALNTVISAGMPSRLLKAWCVICNRVVDSESRKSRVHEREMHPGPDSFRCSDCSRSFICSDDLRKHSRSKQHTIPAAFGQHLRSCLAKDSSDRETGKSEILLHEVNEQDTSTLCTSCPAFGWTEAAHSEVKKAVFIVAGASAKRGSTTVRCALCNHECSPKKLRIHEKKYHERYKFERQDCYTTFTCSQSLRKHSRAKKHNILRIIMLEGSESLSSQISTTDSVDPIRAAKGSASIDQEVSSFSHKKGTAGLSSQTASSLGTEVFRFRTDVGIYLSERPEIRRRWP